MPGASPSYLLPYHAAVRRHGTGFGALLWATPRTQAARFDAVCRLVELQGRRVLDVGCGRADLLDHLFARGVRPAHYIGLEAVPALAAAARQKVDGSPDAQVLEADFVAHPHRLFVGAEVAVLSGSLNTMDAATFYATLGRACEAASQTLVFNFLSSPRLAGAPYLTWHDPAEVEAFAKSLSPRAERLEDYVDGDCTMAVWKR